jgi:hypothetical protein
MTERAPPPPGAAQFCDEGQRAQLLAQIQAHLGQLKKLTYGKHIVGRVEKLLETGAAWPGRLAAGHPDRQTLLVRLCPGCAPSLPLPLNLKAARATRFERPASSPCCGASAFACRSFAGALPVEQLPELSFVGSDCHEK